MGQMAKSVGGAIAQNPGTALAVMQGVGGLIQYATAKKPAALKAPDVYAPTIRPAEGMDATSLELARSGLRETQAAAAGGGTSDVGSSAVMRLLAGREAGRGYNELAGTNSRILQADRARETQEGNAAYGRNYDLQRTFRENSYNQQNREYEARRTQSGAQVQAAVDSVGGIIQQKAQGRQLQLETKNRQAEAQITQLHGLLASAGSADQARALLGQLKQLDPSGVSYQSALKLYGARFGITALGAGGALSFTTKTASGSSTRASKTGSSKAPAVPASVQTFHNMSAQFSSMMDRQHAANKQYFFRALQSAMQLRSVGHAGSSSKK
jgi:hypothetical protein